MSDGLRDFGVGVGMISWTGDERRKGNRRTAPRFRGRRTGDVFYYPFDRRTDRRIIDWLVGCCVVFAAAVVWAVRYLTA